MKFDCQNFEFSLANKTCFCYACGQVVASDSNREFKQIARAGVLLWLPRLKRSVESMSPWSVSLDSRQTLLSGEGGGGGCVVGAHLNSNGPIRVEKETTLRAAVVAGLITSL